MLAVFMSLCGCEAATRSAADVQYRSPLSPVAHVNSSTRAHRRAAIRDAQRLLGGVVAPLGAVVDSSSSGIGPHTLLLTGALDSAVDRRSWMVPEDSSGVLSFVTAHLPPGSKVDGAGSVTGGLPLQYVDHTWASVPGVLGIRLLRIQVTSTGSDQTLLSAVAQSQWIVKRPASERIPTSVGEINVTSSAPRKQPFLSRTVTNQKHVQDLVTLFNSLPLIQPAATSCPAERTDQPVVRITFKDKTTGQPVARASADSGANFTWAPSDGAWECYAVGLDIAGRRGIAVGGNVIGPLQRLLDASLAKPSGK